MVTSSGVSTSEATCCAYLFEAKGIQRWILEGGRLRDIASASGILAASCQSKGSDMLGRVLVQAGWAPEPTFSRRAGGAFMLHYAADEGVVFQRFRALWRLVFMQMAPGLEFQEATGCGSTDMEARRAAYEGTGRLRAGRENGSASLLPLGHPLVAFAPRTGRPAVREDHEELVDLTTDAKRRAWAQLKDALASRFLPAGADPALVWPDQMEADPGPDKSRTPVLFPFVGESRWIALLHADISALGTFYGQVDRGAGSDGLVRSSAAATAIENVVTRAAQYATTTILLPRVQRAGSGALVMPARPILLGGDDITVILRGDLALDFAEAFLTALETESRTELAGFGADLPLTAAAGIAFGKPKQPFFRLLELAEDLCSFAKGRAKQVAGGKRPASVIAFHRVTESALAASADDLFKRLVVGNHKLTAQPYRVGGVEAPGIVGLDRLAELRRKVSQDGLKAGRLREIRSALLQGLDDLAIEEWGRWVRMAERRASKALGSFQRALTDALGGPAADGLFAAGQEGCLAAGSTPLFDALDWNAVAPTENRT